MVLQLKTVVTDQGVAWDAKSLGPKEYIFYFSPEVLKELKERNLVGDYRAAETHLKYSPLLQKETLTFYNKHLKIGPGFVIVKGLSPEEFSREEQEMIYWMVCNVLGKPLEQNAQGDIRYEVKDKGKRMEEGGRYSESRQAGVLHTDSIQWEHPPEIVGLLCLHPAMRGGESVIMSIYSLHNKLLQENPAALSVLYEPFPFETRKSSGELEVIKKPVFKFNEEDGLKFEYIGTYVPLHALSKEQKEAKKILDTVLEDTSLTVNLGTLKAGEMQFLMNFKNAHGRGSDFINYPEPERERIMVRAWLREKK